LLSLLILVYFAILFLTFQDGWRSDIGHLLILFLKPFESLFLSLGFYNGQFLLYSSLLVFIEVFDVFCLQFVCLQMLGLRSLSFCCQDRDLHAAFLSFAQLLLNYSNLLLLILVNLT
jgi:hypothetical protein